MKVSKIFKHRYTQISNVIISDPEIGAGAFRLYVYIFSKPDNWKYNNREIMETLKIRDNGTIAKYWKELINAGWVQRKREQTRAGKFRGRYEYFIFDEKQTVEKNGRETDKREKNRIGKKPEFGKNPEYSNTNKFSNTNTNTINPEIKNFAATPENETRKSDSETINDSTKTKKSSAKKNKKVGIWEYLKTHNPKLKKFADHIDAGTLGDVGFNGKLTPAQIKYIETAVAFWHLMKKNAVALELPTRLIDSAAFDWVDTIRKLYEIDGFTVENMRVVFSVLEKDEFWKRNALSVVALRNKNKSGIMKIENIIASNGRTQKTDIKQTTRDALQIAIEKEREKHPEMFNSDGSLKS